MRARPEHFRVDEVLGFEPDGEGAHVLLQLRKRGLNTQWVARQLARLAGIRTADVGFSGLKDREAVTTQWFSVNLAGVVEPDWSALANEDLEVLCVRPHRRKLRRGVHRANRFILRLVELRGAVDDLKARLQAVTERGVPNYFGEQRFGHDNGNLSKALAVFTGRLRVRDRYKLGIYLSAARAMLFNQVASTRVREASWDQALSGDVMMLAGTHSIFRVDEVDERIRSRTLEGDIDPTGPLWGKGESLAGARARSVEEAALVASEHWCRGLERFGLKQDRRPLRVRPSDMNWVLSASDELDVSFLLPAGAYATSVLREIATTV